MSTLGEWIHDDITFCMKRDCDNLECFRNPENMQNPRIPHSMAMLENTSYCPLFNKEGGDEKE